MTLLQFQVLLYSIAFCFAAKISAEDLSYEKSFSLRLEYEWKDGGTFVVALKNSSKSDLRITLNSQAGEFSILSGEGKGKTFCDREYLRTSRSAIRILPSRDLKAGQEVRWIVNLSDLVYRGIDKDPVSDTSLTGRSVALTLELAVFPAPGKSNVDVKVRSNTIQIPPIEQAEALKP